MGSTKILAFLLAVWIGVVCGQQRTEDESAGRQMAQCLQEGDFGCVTTKVLNNLSKLMKKKSISLMEGVRLEYSGDESTKDAASRALKEHNWGPFLSDILPKLVRNVALKVDESRGHKERFILPILAAGGFYALLITLGVIAAKFLAFKALLVGKISLVLAAITGLAKIFNQKNQGYTQFQSYGKIDNGFVNHPAY